MYGKGHNARTNTTTIAENMEAFLGLFDFLQIIPHESTWHQFPLQEFHNF